MLNRGGDLAVAANRLARPPAGMAWAVRRDSQRPVYIGQLDRAQKGLACDCVCPACNAPLQAVAVGLPATNNRIPFFRHHQAQQGPGCKHRVAELAALRLFADRGIIEIPAPRSTAAVQGFSGRVYEKECVGEAISEAVIGRRAVSDVEVELTLKSGRKVILTLRGEQHLGELGSVHAVIQIRVFDSDVAWMSPEEILEHARLTPKFLQLIAHADLSRLEEQAATEARKQALESLDIAPDDLYLPVGATPKQASESLIHWAVKDSLATLGFLRAPVFRHVSSARSTDGRFHSSEVGSPPRTIELSDIRWEVLVDGYRPDIVCKALDRTGALGRFRLVVEVAKTSKVSATKLEQIRRSGAACIEIDVSRFGISGRLHRSELRSLVANDTESKTWLCHPVLDLLVQQALAKARLAKDEYERTLRVAEERERAEEARRVQEQEQAEVDKRERKQWAQGLDRAAALRELRLLLAGRWFGEPDVTTNGMCWASGEFVGSIRHVLSPGELPERMLGNKGLFWRIHKVLEVASGSSPHLDFASVIGRTDDLWHGTEKWWTGLLHLLVDDLRINIDPAEHGAFLSQRDKVIKSLEAGELTYARGSDHDRAIEGVFPELDALLARPLGTADFALALQQQREAERTVILEEERARAEANRAELEEARRLESTRHAVAQVGYSMAWILNRSAPSSQDQALQNLRLTGNKYVPEADAALIRSAWQFKHDGQSLEAWMHAQAFENAERVEQITLLLRNSFLIQFKTAK